MARRGIRHVQQACAAGEEEKTGGQKRRGWPGSGQELLVGREWVLAGCEGGVLSGV